ncbi:MAG: TIGR04372 family glycosyltransferase, partial [Sphaerospermopsis kisseleviana]
MPQEPFVCLIVRDGSYKATFRREPLIHDVKEAYRNQRIADFEECALVAHEFGTKLVRMGVRVEEGFPGNYESVVDYATSGKRTEATDLFLLSTCILCISTSVGSDSVCGVAGIPRLIVNVVPYLVTANTYEWDVVLPVRFRNRKTQHE